MTNLVIEQWPKRADVGAVAAVEVRVFKDVALLWVNFPTEEDRESGETPLNAVELRELGEVLLWAAARLDRRAPS